MKPSLLFADPWFLRHETGRHPESADRLRKVYAHLDATHLRERFDRGEIVSADLTDLARAHSREYISRIDAFAKNRGGRIEADTVLSRDSYEVARRAAGCAVAAVDSVLSGKHANALCLTRPPGHHAGRSSAMGFCLFNNVVVAALHAIEAQKLARVLIVDWDVHHGNGTQDLVYEDGRVFFFSSHRSPFYPGTGSREETGSGKGLGAIFNLPLAFGITRKEFRERFHSVLVDSARRARPELVLISAGFDAHKNDPIGSLGLESEDFGELTRMVKAVADQYCGGKIVSLLEGGYNLEALAESVQAHADQLAPPR